MCAKFGMYKYQVKTQMAKLFAYLVDIKEEYREVKKDDDEEGQDEYNGQRSEDPQEVLQKTQIVLNLAKTSPFLQ